MNIISRASRILSGGNKEAAGNVQAAPVSWSPDHGVSTITMKVDHAIRLGSAVLVAGWATDPAQVRLRAGGRRLETRRFETPRQDVARYLNRAETTDFGVVLMAEAGAGNAAFVLECLNGDGEVVAEYPLAVKLDTISAEARILLAPALDCLRQSLGSDPAAMRQMEKLLSSEAVDRSFASGMLDDIRSGAASDQAIASGWLARNPGVEAWLEDGQGRKFPLEQAHWIDRPDVSDSMTVGMDAFALHAGFLLLLPGVAAGDRVRLMARLDDETLALTEASCMSLGADPLLTARWLFAFPTPITQFAERVSEIDLPSIEPLIRARQGHWPQLPIRVEEVGEQLPMPKVSVIIPLYGRIDFVEHQLLEFARDPWLRANAEIVYVIDDADLVDRMATDAWSLARLYGVAFRWVWGSANRGFSGANNLGAAHTRGDYLVFLNSDAFPKQPGWLQPLLAALEADTDLGAVGPRLLFGDGSIQHAGMEFRRREDLGIWTNHHPGMGLDPALDPNEALTEVPCVTGACLAMRRVDFDRVEGWDTGYLVGDFEDSDLCLKLRAAGLKIGYLPGVELTHLERQSFKSVGEGDFRMRVVVYNAVRHQQRWQDSIGINDPKHEERAP